jgi:hypothetical protein
MSPTGAAHEGARCDQQTHPCRESAAAAWSRSSGSMCSMTTATVPTGTRAATTRSVGPAVRPRRGSPERRASTRPARRTPPRVPPSCMNAFTHPSPTEVSRFARPGVTRSGLGRRRLRLLRAFGAGIASAAWSMSTTRSRHDVPVSEPHGPLPSTNVTVAASGRPLAPPRCGDPYDYPCRSSA